MQAQTCICTCKDVIHYNYICKYIYIVVTHTGVRLHKQYIIITGTSN